MKNNYNLVSTTVIDSVLQMEGTLKILIIVMDFNIKSSNTHRL